MLQDNLKIKVRVKDLIKKLENQKSKHVADYNRKLNAYDRYIGKISPKIAFELREIADSIENENLEKASIGYRGQISIELKSKLNSKPTGQDTRIIDNALGVLKMSSDEFITIKQSDYNLYFS